MQGLVLSVKKSPRATDLNSYPITVVVPAGATRVINYPSEFVGLASGIQIINRDGANTITITVNNDVINAFTIPASAGISLNDQWVEQIAIVAGAAGTTVVQAQITPSKELGIGL